MSPVSLTVTTRKVPSRALASPMILLYAFAGFITIGTLLLLLPFAHEGSGFTPFMDAFFTATSAVTVTGLVIQETSTYWTRTGQVFILGNLDDCNEIVTPHRVIGFHVNSSGFRSLYSCSSSARSVFHIIYALLSPIY